MTICDVKITKLQSFSVLDNGFISDENLLKSFFSKIQLIKTLKFPFIFENQNMINIF